MHGTNPIRKLEKDSTGEYLQIREIFLTMQGEGPYAGRRAVFTRLTGCMLACTYCDTIWDDAKDPDMHYTGIVSKIMELWHNQNNDIRLGDPLVVLTGGEPTRQKITKLIQELMHKDCVVQIETAGSFWWEVMSYSEVKIVVSPKTPHVHPNVAKRAVAYKYVIRASDQLSELGLPIGSTQEKSHEIRKAIRLAEPPPHLVASSIYVSPCDEGNAELNKANLDVCLKLVLERGYRLNLQQHKIVNLP